MVSLSKGAGEPWSMVPTHRTSKKRNDNRSTAWALFNNCGQSWEKQANSLPRAQSKEIDNESALGSGRKAGH